MMIGQYEVGTLAVDGWATFGTVRKPILAVPNVTAHPSTASVPITVLLYNDPLLCGSNVPVKGLIWRSNRRKQEFVAT